MLRRLLYLAAIPSTLCLLCALLLWPLSYNRALAAVYVSSGGSSYIVGGIAGRLAVGYRGETMRSPGFHFESEKPGEEATISAWSYLTWKSETGRAKRGRS